MDHPALAAVQPLEAVDADVGDARPCAFHAVADLLEGGEHAPEHPLVRRFVCVEDDGPRVAGERFLQRHARCITPAQAGKRSATSGLPCERSAMTTGLFARCGCRCSSTLALR